MKYKYIWTNISERKLQHIFKFLSRFFTLPKKHLGKGKPILDRHTLSKYIEQIKFMRDTAQSV